MFVDEQYVTQREREREREREEEKKIKELSDGQAQGFLIFYYSLYMAFFFFKIECRILLLDLCYFYAIFP